MSSALDRLSQANGLKTTQTVLDKQQSGQDAAQKGAADSDIQATVAATNNRLQAAATKVRPAMTAEVKTAPKPMSYADMFRALNANPDTETAEQKARRERREKTKARIAAVGDGLRALSNMYYATKGAKVVHDPNADMTPALQKRKQMIDAQREKNKAAWLTGYQRAQALDEEARKNNLTLAEQMRYHDMNNYINTVRAAQSQQRIDLSRYRLENLNDYNDRKLQIEKDYKDGMLSEKAKSNAIAQLNAEANMLRAQKSGGKGGSSSSRNNYSGNVEDYINMKENDPAGMAAAEREARGMGYSTKTASGKAAARVIYKRRHGGSSEPMPKKGGGKKGGQKKKTTGVKW